MVRTTRANLWRTLPGSQARHLLRVGREEFHAGRASQQYMRRAGWLQGTEAEGSRWQSIRNPEETWNPNLLGIHALLFYPRHSNWTWGAISSPCVDHTAARSSGSQSPAPARSPPTDLPLGGWWDHGASSSEPGEGCSGTARKPISSTFTSFQSLGPHLEMSHHFPITVFSFVTILRLDLSLFHFSQVNFQCKI